MAFGTLQVKVEARQAIANLSTLALAVQKKISRRAMNIAVRPLAKDVKARAKRVQKRTGQLWRSIGHRVKTYPSGVVIGLVGARSGFRTMLTTKSGKRVPVDPRFYLHLLEFGTKRSRAFPILRPAWDAGRQALQDAYVLELQRGIEMEAARLPKRAA